ncbi:hypothetical protein KM043_005943 [Ampulex compressa]|nr:hypothetical protein KM043_005943 [Ampulex compressa]
MQRSNVSNQFRKVPLLSIPTPELSKKAIEERDQQQSRNFAQKLITKYRDTDVKKRRNYKRGLLEKRVAYRA